MRIAATGHRPPRLGLSYHSEHNRLLTMFAKSVIEESRQGYDELTMISGMAQGWDQAVAHAAVLLGISFIAAIPFDGQESPWPEQGRVRYRELLKRASEVVVVSPGSYAKDKYITRDRWMVNQSDAVLALWDGAKNGGTFETIRYAEDNDLEVVNTWEQWESHFWRARKV